MEGAGGRTAIPIWDGSLTAMWLEAGSGLCEAGQGGFEGTPDIGPVLAQCLEENSDIWIFTYGSLMWNPGFPHSAAEPALLRGWHRSFCIYSKQYRGTGEKPGLVLGLDRGGSCRGLAFRIPCAEIVPALDYLWEREMSGGGVYEMRTVPVALIGTGTRLKARTFTVRPMHPWYAGRQPLDDAARLILQGVGCRGSCRDYFYNTIRHLETLGLADGPLHRLERRVRELARAEA
jgi:glutathione-specific gamma-glutamylcyclotransferase